MIFDLIEDDVDCHVRLAWHIPYVRFDSANLNLGEFLSSPSRAQTRATTCFLFPTFSTSLRSFVLRFPRQRRQPKHPTPLLR